ncbi:MAG: YfhO family protein [Ruminococcaceae bacterium]|nr:YfhO family protein [Oscillospiraceae bacterium]
MENKFVLLSFFVSIFIYLLIALCYEMVPFGDITILRMDLYHQYGPLFAELYDRIVSGKSLIYSWQSGGGSSFLGNYFNYLSSPFSFLILLFGHKNITEAISFLIMLKGALSAGTFTYYLKESDEFKKHDAIAAGFGLLYAFSGYFIAYYWNVMWLDGMYLLPLVILGLERIIDGRNSKLYVLSLAILMFATFYIAYMVCIFAVLYAIMYYFGKYPISKELPKAIIRFILYSLLAGGLAAITLFPTAFVLRSCSATSGTFPTEVSTYFNLFDFLANHLASLEPTIRSSGEDVLPNIFCGVGTILLALLYLYIPSISLKEKISRILMLVTLFLSFNLNYLNFIWHAFHFPNDLPYRFSFIYSFMLLTIGFKALVRINEIEKKTLLSIGLGITIFIVIIEKIGSKNVLTETIVISLIFVVLYTIGFSLIGNKKFQATAVASFIFCCMFAEIAVANTEHYDIDQPKENYTGDYPSFKMLKKELDKTYGDDTYRMELTNLRTRMDPSWYGYNGLSTFSSMAYETSSNLYHNLGSFGNYINSYTYKPQTPVFNAMFALKYLVNNTETACTDPIDNADANKLNPKYYTSIYTLDKFVAYENNYALPIAYCVNKDVRGFTTVSGNPFEAQANYWERATGIDNVFRIVPITNISYNNIQDFGEISGFEVFTFNKVIPDDSASLTVQITPDYTGSIYLYVNSNNVNAITIRNTEDTFFKTQYTSEEYIYDLGDHNAGIPLFIDIPISEGETGTVEIYCYALDYDKFIEGYEILSANTFKIKKQTDTKITGTVTVPKDSILYTSINYDNSWKVYVDGKKLDDSKIYAIADALIAIDIPKGTHEVTFKYQAKGLIPGAIISGVSLLILIALFAIQRKPRQDAEA